MYKLFQHKKRQLPVTEYRTFLQPAKTAARLSLPPSAEIDELFLHFFVGCRVSLDSAFTASVSFTDHPNFSFTLARLLTYLRQMAEIIIPSGGNDKKSLMPTEKEMVWLRSLPRPLGPFDLVYRMGDAEHDRFF